jgi:hypothetical protein
MRHRFKLQEAGLCDGSDTIRNEGCEVTLTIHRTPKRLIHENRNLPRGAWSKLARSRILVSGAGELLEKMQMNPIQCFFCALLSLGIQKVVLHQNRQMPTKISGQAAKFRTFQQKSKL